MGLIRFSETSMMVVHPPSTSFDAFAQDAIAEENGTIGAFNAHDDDYDEWFDRVAETANEVAEEQRVFLDLHTHQLTDITPEAGRKSRRLLEQQDVIVTAAATDAVCALIVAALRGNPVMRCIMGFATKNEIEDRFEVLRAVRTPVFEGGEKGSIKTMPRIVAVIRNDHTSLRKVLSHSMDVRRAHVAGDYTFPEFYRGELK